jgi:molybdenum cofactor synthesis domain-containing protein
VTGKEGPPLRIGILTVSDACSRGERRDESGQILEDWCVQQGHDLVLRDVVPDQTESIVPVLLRWADGGEVDAILTTGGTGFGPRDLTPEATRAVLERPAPGLADAMQRLGEERTPYALLSRGLAGARGEVFLANLPGSPGGARDGIKLLGPLIRHISGLLQGGDTPHIQS